MPLIVSALVLALYYYFLLPREQTKLNTETAPSVESVRLSGLIKLDSFNMLLKSIQRQHPQFVLDTLTLASKDTMVLTVAKDSTEAINRIFYNQEQIVSRMQVDSSKLLKIKFGYQDTSRLINVPYNVLISLLIASEKKY